MRTGQPHKFIQPVDDLSGLLNEKANLLYQKLLGLDISDSGIDDFGKYYFNSHHAGRRRFFSIQSSAAIIYHAVKRTGKPPGNLAFMDYGAGLGTLFLLAGMTGFKKVYFNDYFPEWAGYARIICDKLDIRIDDFISGDIDAVISYAQQNNIHIDIIASRNVAEHIYDLRSYYTKLHASAISSVCYATTTANYHNPAMRLKHHWYHKKVENASFKKQREDRIKELVPGINAADLRELVKLTRGRAFGDFTNAVDLYLAKKPVPAVEFLGTNTCDCKTGVWAEHLVSRKDYEDIIQKAGYAIEYTAGFWDTNYRYGIINMVTGVLNRIIKIAGPKGYWLAPFVNVVAFDK